MSLLDLIKRIIYDFFVIFTGIIFCTAIFSKVFIGYGSYEVTTIFQLMILSFLCSCLTLIFYSKEELSKKGLIVRKVIHFICLEFFTTFIIFKMNWVNSKDIRNVFTIMIMIFIIYAIVNLVGWFTEKNEADKINKKLKELYK